MTPLKKVKSQPDIVDYFKELLFYGTYINKTQNQILQKH